MSRAAIDFRCDDGRDRQLRCESFFHLLNRRQRIAQRIERHHGRFDWNQDRIRRHHRIDRERPQAGRCIDEQVIPGLRIQSGDGLAQKNARDLHDSYLQDAGSVEPNVAAAATGVVAAKGGPDEYEVFLARHKDPATPQEERRYQSALAGFPGEAEMKRTLDMTLSGDVRTQDAPYLLAVCLRNREQGYLAWQFIKDNWDKINDVFPSNSIVRMLSGITSLSKSEQADDIISFFEDHDVPQGQLTLKQMLEKLRVNVAYRERESDRFGKGLME